MDLYQQQAPAGSVELRNAYLTAGLRLEDWPRALRALQGGDEVTVRTLARPLGWRAAVALREAQQRGLEACDVSGGHAV